MVQHVNGKEVVDQTPVSVPSGWSRPEPLADTIRRMVRAEVSRAAAAEDMETFEEADDFDCEDDDDPLSQYEIPEGRQEPVGGAESVEGSLPPVQPAIVAPGPATQAAGASPSTDSSTVTPPAGGSSRS